MDSGSVGYNCIAHDITSKIYQEVTHYTYCGQLLTMVVHLQQGGPKLWNKVTVAEKSFDSFKTKLVEVSLLDTGQSPGSWIYLQLVQLTDGLQSITGVRFLMTFPAGG